MSAVMDTGDQVQDVVTKAKAKGPQDLIQAAAHEIENLSKTKALNLAKALAEDIDSNSFKLGGVLSVIHKNAWFEGYESFEAMVYDRFGFKARKADYLMRIYQHLVDQQIPWDKVAHIGWTKLKELVSGPQPVLTADNVDEWVGKVSPLSYAEMMKLLKGKTETVNEASASTTSSTKKISFSLKNDQIETVQMALASVKAQINTDYDDVALENLCAAYLAGVGGQVQKPKSLLETIKESGYEAVLAAFEVAYPQIDLTVQLKEGS